MSIINTLESLEAIGSRLAKEEILRSNIKNQLLISVFDAASDPYKNYYVTKFKMPPHVESGDADDDVIKEFLEKTLLSLSTRSVVGNTAKGLVEDSFSKMTFLQQKWCNRILLKNLRCGVSDTTINKFWPGVIKKFAVALAESLSARWSNDRLVIDDDLTYPVIIEPKLDGLRIIAIKSSGKVTLYTRNGTLIETLPTITASLELHPLNNIVFDGEAIGQDWNESASIIMSRKNSKGDGNIVYHVFDVVPLKSWMDRTSDTKFEERRKFLEKLFVSGIPTGIKCLKITDKIIAGSEGDILRYYDKCLALGYEGVMIKNPESKYLWKRSDSILKLKPVSTYEGVIVGWHKGGTGSKRQDLFGGFSVLLSNGCVTQVGSGLDDKIRTEVETNGPNSYIGKIIECEAQSLTDDGKMRFPVFIRFRSESDIDPQLLAAYSVWKLQ